MKSNGEQHIELNVELAHDPVKGDDYNVLVVNQGRHHQDFEKVDESTHHTITWTLTGNASNGEFCELDDANNPGFVWLIRKPSEKIFHKLALKGKNKVSIHNHHHNKKSEGTWHYQLFARFGDKIYGVPLTFSAGSGNNPNPSIKNN